MILIKQEESKLTQNSEKTQEELRDEPKPSFLGMVCLTFKVFKLPIICKMLFAGSPIKFFNMLKDAFGIKILVMLFATCHLLKGFIKAMINAPASWIFRSKNVVGTRMQVLNGFAHLPYCLKPVIGLVSDFMPLFGFHKVCALATQHTVDSESLIRTPMLNKLSPGYSTFFTTMIDFHGQKNLLML